MHSSKSLFKCLIYANENRDSICFTIVDEPQSFAKQSHRGGEAIESNFSCKTSPRVNAFKRLAKYGIILSRITNKDACNDSRHYTCKILDDSLSRSYDFMLFLASANRQKLITTNKLPYNSVTSLSVNVDSTSYLVVVDYPLSRYSRAAFSITQYNFFSLSRYCKCPQLFVLLISKGIFQISFYKSGQSTGEKQVTGVTLSFCLLSRVNVCVATLFVISKILPSIT